MSRHSNFIALSVCATAIICVSMISSAGDLNPPAGPVAQTPGPEPRIPINATNTPGDANSLFKITQPGSYYLTQERAGIAGRHGIEIGASDVTIDLMGFTLRGVPGSLDGISRDAAFNNNVRITNGFIRNWGGDGIGLDAGAGHHISAVHSSNNGAVGIFCSQNAIVESCTASANTNDGIFVSAGSIVTDCSCYSNGDDGISAGDGCTVSNCSARVNTRNGIQISAASLVLHNNCDSNGNGGNGAGIHATSSDARIEGNNCTDSDRGIDVDGGGNIIIRNTCSGNTTNWDIAEDNALAPIIIATYNFAPVNGASYAGPFGTTDPWANFSY